MFSICIYLFKRSLQIIIKLLQESENVTHQEKVQLQILSCINTQSTAEKDQEYFWDVLNSEFFVNTKSCDNEGRYYTQRIVYDEELADQGIEKNCLIVVGVGSSKLVIR